LLLDVATRSFYLYILPGQAAQRDLGERKMKLLERMGVLSLVMVGGASFAASSAPAAPPPEFDIKSSFLTAVAALDGAQMLRVDSNAGQAVYPGTAQSDPTFGFGSATPVQSTVTPKASLDVDMASDDGPAGSVPEPGTWWLMLAGAGAAATLYSRRR
jgi:hypothetical protein